MAKYDDNKAANDAKKKAYKDQFDQKLISKGQYDKKVTEADLEMDKKERALKRKQAEREKALNIFQAIVNTASAVAEALPNEESDEKRLLVVNPVDDPCVKSDVEAKVLVAKTFRKRRDEDPREKLSVIDGVMLPAIWRRSVGALTPIPTLPLARTLKSDEPEEDATLNGLTPADPCTLSVKSDDVAFTPRTEPLSIKVEVPTVVAVNQRVA